MPLVRIPKSQLVEVDVGERLMIQKLDDVMISKEDIIQLPQSRPPHDVWAKTVPGRIFEPPDSKFFEEIWKRRAIETQQEILERQLGHSNDQQRELAKTLQSIAEALKPQPIPVSKPETEKPKTETNPSQDVLSMVHENLEAAREDFSKEMKCLAKSVTMKLESSATGSKRDIEESLEAYMSRVQNEFGVIRQEVRSVGERQRTPSVMPPVPPLHSTELVLDPPICNFYDDIRLEMDQLHSEMQSLTWVADLSKRPRVKLQAATAPVLKKRTEPYSGKKVAVSDAHAPISLARQVQMSTQKPAHLKDSGRKLLDLPDKIRPMRGPKRKSLQCRLPPRQTSMYHPATRHPAFSSTSNLSPERNRLAPRPNPTLSEVLAQPWPDHAGSQHAKVGLGHAGFSGSEHVHAGFHHTQDQRPSPCRPREVQDLQLLLPPPCLFEAPKDVVETPKPSATCAENATQTNASLGPVVPQHKEEHVPRHIEEHVPRHREEHVPRHIEEQNVMLARILEAAKPAKPDNARPISVPLPVHAVPRSKTPTRTVGTQAQDRKREMDRKRDMPCETGKPVPLPSSLGVHPVVPYVTAVPTPHITRGYVVPSVAKVCAVETQVSSPSIPSVPSVCEEQGDKNSVASALGRFESLLDEQLASSSSESLSSRVYSDGECMLSVGEIPDAEMGEIFCDRSIGEVF